MTTGSVASAQTVGGGTAKQDACYETAKIKCSKRMVMKGIKTSKCVQTLFACDPYSVGFHEERVGALVLSSRKTMFLI